MISWRICWSHSDRLGTFLGLILLACLSEVCHARLVVCVCPQSFQKAWQPWVDYRSEQGYVISIVRPQVSAAGIREVIKDVSATQDLKAVVLLGE